MNNRKIAVAIDVGGTTLSAALVNSDYQILDQEDKRIEEGVFSDILLSTVNTLLARNTSHFSIIACAGIGLPEYVNEGEVLSNLVVNWQPDTKTQLDSLIYEIVGSALPFCIESDVRCGAIGEYSARPEITRSSILYISWGTGISTTIVLSDGSCLAGARGEALSFGEWRICKPGDDGLTLEKYVSGKGMAKQFKELTGNELTSIQIAELAEGGDLVATEFLQRVGSVLALEIAKLALVLDPDEIILGGGIGSSDSYVKRQVVSSYSDLKTDLGLPPIISTRLSDFSGIIGAAIFAFRLLEK